MEPKKCEALLKKIELVMSMDENAELKCDTIFLFMRRYGYEQEMLRLAKRASEEKRRFPE